MKLLIAVWENVYGLFVDDGSIALGTLGALAVAGLWATAAGANAAQRNLAGPILFVLMMALLLANLYVTGQNAARKRM